MDFRTDNPLFLRNLQLYPLLTDKPIEYRLQAIDTLLDEKKIQIEELDTPVIDKVDLNNLGDQPLLIIDGEEIAGAMQNRIVSASTFIPAKTRKTLSVVCVEEGRWQSIGRFTTGFCSYPRLRSILLTKRPVNELQQDIWNEITQKIVSTRINSVTSSMHDIYKGLDDELNRYLEDFSTLNDKAIGFIGVAGNRILGCDLFANNSIFRQFERKLIRGYAMEACELTKKELKNPDIINFVKSISDAIEEERSGKKTRVHFAKRNLAGQAVFNQKVLLHLSAFPS